MRPAARWLALGVIAAGACGESAPPELTVQDGFTIAGSGTVAVYLDIGNDGAQDRLVGADLPSSKGASVSLHRTTERGGRSVMEPVDAITLPAHDKEALRPRDAHLMVEGLTDDLATGDQIIVRVHFERSEARDVDIDVLPVDEALERMNIEGDR